MAEYPWRRLGELLVERGLIDEHRLEAALTEQSVTGQLLGELLVESRDVSAHDIAIVLAEQHGLELEPNPHSLRAPSQAEAASNGGSHWRPLGRILVDKGLLTESGLHRLLQTQRRTGGLLGSLLLERGYVTAGELAEALAEQHGVAVPETISSSERQSLSPGGGDVFYEVRPAGDDGASALHVSPSFLDASDFAFELLYDEDPDALEIVEVKGGQRRVAWAYRRPAGEAREAG